MSRRILIVDDERNIRDILQLTFERAGYTVQTATSEYEALTQLFGPEPPDAVIVGDLAPRPTSSLALVHDIRQALPKRCPPIVMLSTQVRELDISAGIHAGAACYLKKPFSIKLLTEVVNGLTARAAA